MGTYDMVNRQHKIIGIGKNYNLTQDIDALISGISSRKIQFINMLSTNFHQIIEANERILTYLAPSTHWEFSIDILKLNEKMAPKMSVFFNWLPLFCDDEFNNDYGILFISIEIQQTLF